MQEAIHKNHVMLFQDCCFDLAWSLYFLFIMHQFLSKELYFKAKSNAM